MGRSYRRAPPAPPSTARRRAGVRGEPAGASRTHRDWHRGTETDHCRGPSLLPLLLAGVLGGETSDRRPVECLAPMREQRQEPVVQHGGERHGYAKGLRRGEGETDVLVSQRRGEPRRLELLLGNQPTIGLVDRPG